MKAVHHIRHAEISDAVRIVDLPDPIPGPGDIVVRMEAAAVHLADVYRITGRRGFKSETLPTIPGYEGIGRVAAVGEGVTQFKVGDRVFPWWGAGTFAQLIRANAATALPAPEGDAQQLALTLVNGMTAVILLEDFRTLSAGDWLIQNGANSNCGRYLIVLAKEKGLKSCNIVRRREVMDELYALGADKVILDDDSPDVLEARVKEATGDAKISLGFDMVAGAATARLARCLTTCGLVVNYGFISREPVTIHFDELFRKDVSLVGMSTGRGMAKRTPDEIRRIYAKLGTMIGSGKLKAAIAAAYPIERAVEAFEQAYKTGAERDGKVIILPNG